MRYIHRTLEAQFERLSSVYNILTLVGPRQSGKTTLLKRMLGKFGGEYITLDDPDVRRLFNQDIKKFENQYLRKDCPIGVDEVQYGVNAGKKLKYLADKGYYLWITSSSERILAKDILGYLVGRTTILRLYPFSFNEFKRARGIKVDDVSMNDRLVWEHAIFGGYPKVVLEEQPDLKVQILSDIRETLILKDVMLNFSIDRLSVIERLVEFLSINIGQVLSYETIRDTIQISHQTLEKYLDALEKSYVIKRVRPFYTNKTKELSKRPKIYFIDTGLRNSVIKNWSITGPLFENYVFTELLKIGKEPRYWRTKNKTEVDFVVDGIPIEVKMNANKVTSGMRSFIKAYHPDIALMIGKPGVEEKEVIIDETSVVFTDVTKLDKYL